MGLQELPSSPRLYTADHGKTDMASVIHLQAGGEDDREEAWHSWSCRPHPTAQPGALGGTGQRRQRETEEDSLKLEEGSRARPPQGREAQSLGLTEPVPAELGTELSFRTQSGSLPAPTVRLLLWGRLRQ